MSGSGRRAVPRGTLARRTSPANGSLREWAYARLKEDLLSGTYFPGQLLQEKELAESFGVSKTPIREALSELVKDRFIQLIPRKGYLISPVDPREVRDNIHLRAILECSAVQLAAKRATQAQLQALKGLILPKSHDGRAPLGRKQLVAYGRNNIRFHQTIALASGNRALARAVTKVLEDLTRGIFTYYSLPDIQETAQDHLDIVSALAEGDEARAKKIMLKHLRVTRDRVLGALLEGGIPPWEGEVEVGDLL
jgi:DNA-binding GntR family transcriptional regulator